jgi:hypothetical protein
VDRSVRADASPLKYPVRVVHVRPDCLWDAFVSLSCVVLDSYADGHSYGWFTVFERTSMTTFYTEVLKLFTPYQGGGLDIVTEQTDDRFASV